MLDVCQHRVFDERFRVVGSQLIANRGRCVLVGNHPGDVDQVGLVEQALIELHVKLRRMREFDHLQCVLYRFSLAANPRFLRTARNRDNLEIDPGRPMAVEPQFFLAIMLALFQRGVIQELELQRFLDLVSERAGQNDP